MFPDPAVLRQRRGPFVLALGASAAAHLAILLFVPVTASRTGTTPDAAPPALTVTFQRGSPGEAGARRDEAGPRVSGSGTPGSPVPASEFAPARADSPSGTGGSHQAGDDCRVAGFRFCSS